MVSASWGGRGVQEISPSRNEEGPFLQQGVWLSVGLMAKDIAIHQLQLHQLLGILPCVCGGGDGSSVN